MIKTSMISLRSKDVSLPIIGKPRSEALSMLKLPTNRDVLQRFTFFMKVEKNTRSQSVNQTCAEIVALWEKIAGQTSKSYQSLTKLPITDDC